ncbi:hypothetical protein Bbelb_388050 [Branchiostoma belcheri]|nr:hypothetical protein Bbelb_388050 [Branchiostoma belcheri]
MIVDFHVTDDTVDADVTDTVVELEVSKHEDIVAHSSDASTALSFSNQCETQFSPLSAGALSYGSHQRDDSLFVSPLVASLADLTRPVSLLYPAPTGGLRTRLAPGQQAPLAGSLSPALTGGLHTRLASEQQTQLAGYSSPALTGGLRTRLGPDQRAPLASSMLPVPTGGSPIVQRWHVTVHCSGLPNYKGARIPVPSKLNVPAWRHLLADYKDETLCDLIEFGFPVNYTAAKQPVVPPTNHASAVRYSAHVADYITKERDHGATIGPLPSDFFDPALVCNPLQTVPKKDSNSRRIVVDFSFPDASSVNAGIPTDTYLGERLHLRYPSVDDLTAIVVRLGPGCLLYKRDLRRAYRQIYVDPADYHLLGFQWKGLCYADVVYPFGIRTGALVCQRVTDAVRFISGTFGYACVNYLDDLGGADTPARAPAAFEHLGHLLALLGLQEADDKAVPPTTRLVFLGRIIDSVRMTIEVTPERLTDTLEELRVWSSKVHTRRRDIESLLGKLQFIASCVRPGRLFVSRMLLFLKQFPDRHTKLRITDDFRRDLAWWRTFLPTYNGISLLPQSGWTEADAVFSSDACLTGCGGFLNSTGEFFHSTFPPSVLEWEPCINGLELLTILVCARLWGRHWSGMRIVVLCDNEASVTVLNSGRSRSPFLQSCLRNLWLCAATDQFEIRAVHLPGVHNRLADHLSRWHTSPSHREAFLHLTAGTPVTQATVAAAKRSAFSAGTYNNLRTQWRSFLLFCEYYGLPALPTTSATLARYALFLSRSCKSPNTVKIYVHGVRQLHLFYDFPPPPDSAFELKLVFMSLARHSTHTPQQKLPITPEILLSIRSLLDLQRPLHATLWAVFCIGFFTLLRKSNLVPPSRAAFSADKHLTRASLQLTPDGLIVRITWSKTRQFRQKVLQLPVAAIPGHPLCPRAAYLHMTHLLPASGDSPAFLVPGSDGSLVSLTHSTLVSHLKTLLQAAGFPSNKFSGHSFRRGGATFAWHCGADPQTIKLMGDWSSDAYEVYLDSSLEQRWSFSKHISHSICQSPPSSASKPPLSR